MTFSFEHIDDSTTRVSGYTIPIKDIIKRHSGVFEGSSRTWLVPTSEVARLQSEIMVYEQHQRQDKEKKWAEALKKCGLDFVKKGTTQYLKVLATYKNL